MRWTTDTQNTADLFLQIEFPILKVHLGVYPLLSFLAGFGTTA
jgi:hypothetical protein